MARGRSSTHGRRSHAKAASSTKSTHSRRKTTHAAKRSRTHTRAHRGYSLMEEE